MGIYEEFGLRPIINLWGTATRLGGSLIDPEAMEAMVLASKECVLMEELQAAASQVISEITGAEAGYVTSGAASGLMCAAAAFIAGLDVAKMDKLPDTSGMPNEIIMARDQRCGYDHAIRAAGARIVEVGYNESLTGANRPVEPWEFEVAICDQTVGIALIAYDWNPKNEEYFREVIELAKNNNIPVMIDAAGAAPPVDNLRKFNDMGADMVTYSGGKAIRGPQNTGILCGRKSLIASVALQHLDAGGFSNLWAPPESLIPKNTLKGQPRQGICRPQKVSREAVIGLLVRLKKLSKDQTISEAHKMESCLQKIMNQLKDVTSVKCEILNPASCESGAVPALRFILDKHMDAEKITLMLREGNPRLWVNEKSIKDNILTITAINLDDVLSEIVANRLKEVFNSFFIRKENK